MKRFSFHLSAIHMLAILAAAAISALGQISIAEHKGSIDESREMIAEVLRELAEAEAGVTEFDHAQDDAEELRELIPATVSVNTGKGNIDVSNAWIHERLKEFETADNARRAVILNEIDERLTSVSWELEQIVAASESKTSKDETKRKLAQILAREEYQKPTIPEKSMLETWLEKISDWFANLFPRASPAGSMQGIGSVTSVLRIVIIGVVVLLVGFGLYKLLPLLMPSLKRRKKREKKERVVLGEVLGADETAATLFDQAEQIARSGDIRGAIRKGYVALICELGDRRLIGLARHRTNRDYLRELAGTPPVHTEVKEITGIFERHWYGEAAGDTETWTEFRDRYLSALKVAQ